VEVGGGYQFKTVAYYHPWVRQIFQEKAAKRLSIQALECLSIIAYRQPMSKAEIEAIRGVISDGAMKTLLERRLVTITGRSDKPGRPLLYGTTPEFLKYFGLNRIEDLPNIEEFEAMVRQKIENLPIEELASAQSRAQAQSESPFDEAGNPEPGQEIDAASLEKDGWEWLNGKNDGTVKKGDEEALESVPHEPESPESEGIEMDKPMEEGDDAGGKDPQ
jgi:segregation and condensation protein B